MTSYANWADGSSPPSVKDDLTSPASCTDSKMVIIESSKRFSPRTLSIWPQNLTVKQGLLFDRYIHRFSRMYPVFSGPSNPFLSIFLPMAMNNQAVLNGLLVVSGSQTWGAEWRELQPEILYAKHYVLRSCQDDLKRFDQTRLSGRHNVDTSQLIYLTASITTLLIYEKLSGESSQYWKPHLDFIGYVFNNAGRLFSQSCRSDDTFRFLLNLFIYNDLVRSTSTGTCTISNFYIDATASGSHITFFATNTSPLQLDPADIERYYYPSLISRISARDSSVTLCDINMWNRRFDWFPSNCLEGMDAKKQDITIAAELYRITAIIHHQHMLSPHTSLYGLPQTGSDQFRHHRYAMQLLNSIPDIWSMESVLLWPICIIAPDLTIQHLKERDTISKILERLEQRFRMRHFHRAREKLQERWSTMDRGIGEDMWPLHDLILQG
jgi:hypothetical protein